MSETIVKDPTFKVVTYTLYDGNPMQYTHWADGLKMVIEKQGVSISLNEEEIKLLVKSLPRTLGGSY